MNKSFAHFLSFIGHPLLVLSYVLLILLWVNPYAFGVHHLSDPRAMVLFISVFASTFVIPGFGVALMKPLGLIKSLEMHDKQERTGPYIVSGVFYLWLFKNLADGAQAPALYATFVLGATIGLFLAFFFNIFTKISAHATGMGGFVAMILLTAWEWSGRAAGVTAFGGSLVVSMNILLALVILLAGLVGTARLALGAHTPADLYCGYAAGVGAVVMAYWLMGV